MAADVMNKFASHENIAMSQTHTPLLWTWDINTLHCIVAYVTASLTKGYKYSHCIVAYVTASLTKG